MLRNICASNALLPSAIESPKLQKSSPSSPHLISHLLPFLPLIIVHLTYRHIPSPLSCLSFIFLPLYETEVLLGTVNVRYSLFADGYEHKTAGKLKYWINKTSSSKTKLPIFFFHGIGGVFSYLKLLSGLNIFGCPIVIVEMPYVSLHVAPHVPTIDEHVTAVEQILDEKALATLLNQPADAASGSALPTQGIHVGNIRGRQGEAARSHGTHDIGDMIRVDAALDLYKLTEGGLGGPAGGG